MSTRARLRFVTACGVAAALMVVTANIASADNCGSFSDCYGTAQTATAAGTALALTAVIAIRSNFSILNVVRSVTGRDPMLGTRVSTWERIVGMVPLESLQAGGVDVETLWKDAAMNDFLGELREKAPALLFKGGPEGPVQGMPLDFDKLRAEAEAMRKTQQYLQENVHSLLFKAGPEGPVREREIDLETPRRMADVAREEKPFKAGPEGPGGAGGFPSRPQQPPSEGGGAPRGSGHGQRERGTRGPFTESR